MRKDLMKSNDTSLRFVKQETLYENPRNTIVSNVYQTDDNTTVVRYGLTGKDGVTIVPKLSDNRYIVIREARQVPHPETSIVYTQFPSGTVEKGEAFSSAAKREICEETGLNPEKVDSIEKIADYYPSMGQATERVQIYLVENIKEEDLGAQHLDADESISVTTATLKELMELLKAGEIVAGPTCQAILWMALRFPEELS